MIKGILLLTPQHTGQAKWATMLLAELWTSAWATSHFMSKYAWKKGFIWKKLPSHSCHITLPLDPKSKQATEEEGGGSQVWIFVCRGTVPKVSTSKIEGWYIEVEWPRVTVRRRRLWAGDRAAVSQGKNNREVKAFFLSWWWAKKSRKIANTSESWERVSRFEETPPQSEIARRGAWKVGV